MIADDVRDMLQRQAAAVQPSPDAWERIAERIDTPMVAMPTPLHRPARRRPWMMPMMAAAAVIAMLAAAVTVIDNNDAGDRLDWAEPPADPEIFSTPGPAAATAPIWPVTDVAKLTDSGDGAEVARRYLAEFVPGAQAGAFDPSENGSNGIVRYTVKGAEGQVQLGSVDGKWFVTGATTTAIDVHMLTFDGKSLTGEAMPTTAGTLRMKLIPVGLQGRGTAVALPSRKVAGPPEQISGSLPVSSPAVILQLQLEGGFAEYRVESASKPAEPATSAHRDAEAVRTFVQALGRGDMEAAWELVDERSRNGIRGYREFMSMEAELSEGWGGWANVHDAAYYTIPLPTPGVSVVVITGTRADEGPAETTSSAVPVRSGKVDPFVQLGDVEFGAADATWINVSVPAGRQVWFIMDDGPLITADVDGTKATASVDPPLQPGRHHLTVVLGGPNGALATWTHDYSFR